MPFIKTKYLSQDCDFHFGRYPNGTTAIQLVSDYGQEMTITVALEGVSPAPDSILVKSYSENEGLAEALEELGLIEPVHAFHVSGFVEVGEYKMAGALLTQYREQVPA